jgi:kynureninase
LGKPSGRRTFYAEKPWWDYHERLAKPLGKIMGALPSEITMNTLTVNLHLLMVSFYRPTKEIQNHL